MKWPVDACDSVTGWSASIPGITFSLTSYEEYIAEHFGNALLVTIPSGSRGQTFEKTVTLTGASNVTHFVVTAWSRRRASPFYPTIDSYSYQMQTFGPGTGWYGFPVFPGVGPVTMHPVVWGGNGTRTFRFKVNHDDADVLLLSAAYLVSTELPLDILTGIKAEIEYWRDTRYAQDRYVCDVEGLQGAKELVISSASFIDRYAVVTIWNDANDFETHQIDTIDGEKITFLSTYDGRSLTRDYDPATGGYLYLEFPVVYGTTEIEAAVPSIALWTMAPEPLLRTGLLASEVSAAMVTDDAWVRSREYMNMKFPVLIDITSRHNETLAFMSRFVRNFLSRGVVWINGARHNFVWSIPSRETLPTLPVETLPQVQYTLEVEVLERQDSVEDQSNPADASTVTVTPVSEV